MSNVVSNPTGSLMRHTRSTLALFVALFSAHSAGAQSWSATLTPAAAQADYDLLRNALTEAHGALYRFVPKPELERRFDAYRKRLDHPVSRLELAGVLNEMVAGIGDGHARLDFDDSTNAQLSRAVVFPYRVSLEGDRLIVSANDAPDDLLIVPGTEIVRINGATIQELTARILPKLPRDGFIETGRRRRFGLNFPQLYWLYVEQPARFEIDARSKSGSPLHCSVQGISEVTRRTASRPLNAAFAANAKQLDGPTQNISLRFFADSTVGVMKIRGFIGGTFVAEMDSVIHLANARNARGVVLDLRGNGGGVDMYGAALVGEFATAPFRYFDHISLTTINPSFATWKPETFDDLKANAIVDPKGGYFANTKMHPGIVEQQPAKEPFRGKLVVMLDGGTFSTAADVTSVLRSLGRATFIGEESAGAYEGNTSGLNADVRLPNSGFKFRVQMFGYVNSVTPAEKGRGTLADIVMPRRIEDVLNGRDPALERAVAVAGAPR